MHEALLQHQKTVIHLFVRCVMCSPQFSLGVKITLEYSFWGFQKNLSDCASLWNSWAQLYWSLSPAWPLVFSAFWVDSHTSFLVVVARWRGCSIKFLNGAVHKCTMRLQKKWQTNLLCVYSADKFYNEYPWYSLCTRWIIISEFNSLAKFCLKWHASHIKKGWHLSNFITNNKEDIEERMHKLQASN